MNDRHRPSRMFVLFAAVACSLAPVRRARADDTRFSGRTVNGERVVSEELKDWHDTKSRAVLGGRAILDDANPFRWIVDESTPPASIPTSYVEFAGGDRLPGRVEGPGTDTVFDRVPSHVLVTPDVPVDDPQTRRATRIRVATRWIRRIAWDSDRRRPFRPATLFHRDGRRTSFRTLRWGQGVVLALTADGLKTTPIRDLVEVHFPDRDEWTAYLDELAVLGPGEKDRLMQWETRDGLRVTSSTSRFEPGHRGDRRRHENWFHRVQPCWSLEPFWIRFGSLRGLRIWRQHEVPLSRIRPTEVRRKSVFGSSWQWQVDRSTRGTGLRSADQPFGWGFGVHARTELHFELPPTARAFEATIGLDAAAGTGGSVRMAVHLGPDLGKRLYRSPLLIGSGKTLSTGRIALGNGQSGRRLVLVAEMANGSAPAGADPFDVRDACNWLDPIVHLDPAALAEAVRARVPTLVPALQDWTSGEESPLALTNTWNTHNPTNPRYENALRIDGPFASWRQTVDIGPQDRWLAIAVHRVDADDVPPIGLRVEVDGQLVGEVDIPQWGNSWGPNPILAPLDERVRGREVDLRLVALPREPGRGHVVWQGIAPVEHPPHLLRVFDEDIAFDRRLNAGTGTATVTLEDSSRGDAALVVTPTERGRERLPDLEVAIRERPGIGEFRFLRFAWKKNGGKQIALRIAHEGHFGADDENVRPRVIRERSAAALRGHRNRDRRGATVGYQYDSSLGIPPGRAALRLGNRPPEQWQVVFRDLFNDFGDFTLTGFSFDALDGEAAYFDQVYLARNGSDFAVLDRPGPPSLPPEFAAWETDPWRYNRVTTPVTGAFSTTAIGVGAIRLREFRGRQQVLRLHGPNNRACVFRQPITVPKGGKGMRLKGTLSHNPKEPWLLVVRVGADKLYEKVVDENLTGEDGWAEIDVDLKRYAGRAVVVEVENGPHGGRRGHAFWQSLRIE